MHCVRQYAWNLGHVNPRRNEVIVADPGSPGGLAPHLKNEAPAPKLYII